MFHLPLKHPVSFIRGNVLYLRKLYRKLKNQEEVKDILTHSFCLTLSYILSSTNKKSSEMCIHAGKENAKLTSFSDHMIIYANTKVKLTLKIKLIS